MDLLLVVHRMLLRVGVIDPYLTPFLNSSADPIRALRSSFRLAADLHVPLLIRGTSSPDRGRRETREASTGLSPHLFLGPAFTHDVRTAFQ